MNIHTENIDNEGQITDGVAGPVSTYYSPLIGVVTGDGYLRVICDAEGSYTETRISFDALAKVGFVQATIHPAPENL